MIEHISIIDCLADQIASMLDLMRCAGEDTDLNSIRCVADMCDSNLLELMKEVNKIGDEWKEAHTVKVVDLN